ncbi:MAG: indolepyruvate ferredoxin oxidoreductase [Spirochaetes bacterium]|nr:MAG: indolepyruvate ferredoxin oxidoreductase [Spirochaetota bacterium]
MKRKDINFLVVGVGGQGTILSGDILSAVGMEAGYDVKKSDILGLAIRGGSVVSHVRWGEVVGAPMSMKGTIHYLIAFEPLEALRGLGFLAPEGVVLLNTYAIPPVVVTTGELKYPSWDEIEARLRERAEVVYGFNATEKAQSLGNVRTVNVILLGALSNLLDVPASLWEETIKKYVPSKYEEINVKAFNIGQNLIKEEQKHENYGY